MTELAVQKFHTQWETPVELISSSKGSSTRLGIMTFAPASRKNPAWTQGLNQGGRIMAEYVWLGGSETCMGGFDLRSKTK